MSAPTAGWLWRCRRCGKTYPPDGQPAAVKSDAEQQWKYHRDQNCQTPLTELLTEQT